MNTRHFGTLLLIKRIEYTNFDLEYEGGIIHIFKRKPVTTSLFKASCGLYKYSELGLLNLSERYNDLIFIRHIVKNFYSLNDELLLSENLDLHCILIDIQSALDKIDITEKQKKILDMYMNGYPIHEIGVRNGYTKSYVDSVLTKICRRIKKELGNEG